MRRIGSKRKSKKEKVRNTKQNGVDREESEASTNGAQESDAEAEENPEEAEDSAEEPEPVEAKRSKKKHSKRVSFSSKKSDESKENDEEEMQYEASALPRLRITVRLESKVEELGLGSTRVMVCLLLAQEVQRE